MGRLDGKVVPISGEARRQGTFDACMKADEAAKVVIVDILDDLGRQVETELAEAELDMTCVLLDVSSEDDWHAAVSIAVSTYGHLETPVNNAGIDICTGIEDTNVEDWDRTMDVHAKGVFLGTKASFPALREAGDGPIVNILSTTGLVGSPRASTSCTATKGAVRLLTKSTAIQHASEGIRCNSVHPGPIDTERARDSFADPVRREARMRRLPLKRIGTPEDIAFGVNYLASNGSSFVTGSKLVTDGGTTAE